MDSLVHRYGDQTISRSGTYSARERASTISEAVKLNTTVLRIRRPSTILGITREAANMTADAARVSHELPCVLIKLAAALSPVHKTAIQTARSKLSCLMRRIFPANTTAHVCRLAATNSSASPNANSPTIDTTVTLRPLVGSRGHGCVQAATRQQSQAP